MAGLSPVVFPGIAAAADQLVPNDPSDAVNVLLNAVTVAVLIVLLKWVHRDGK